MLRDRHRGLQLRPVSLPSQGAYRKLGSEGCAWAFHGPEAFRELGDCGMDLNHPALSLAMAIHGVTHHPVQAVARWYPPLCHPPLRLAHRRCVRGVVGGDGYGAQTIVPALAGVLEMVRRRQPLEMVRVTGFEPATSRIRGEHSTRLSYTLMVLFPGGAARSALTVGMFIARSAGMVQGTK